MSDTFLPRGVAETLADPEAKRMMLDVAANYEKLAQRAAKRARGEQ
jgi:hypothetical protein